MAKVKKTFRIEEDAYDELVELADRWGVSQGAAVERAIRDARHLPDTCQPAGAGVEAAIGALTDQLAAKDGQIAALGRALDAAHETAKAAQGDGRASWPMIAPPAPLCGYNRKGTSEARSVLTGSGRRKVLTT